MQESERGAFAELVTSALAYHKAEATPFVLNVWWQGCRPFTLAEVRAALTAHALGERGNFAPMVSDIVKALRGTVADRALVAWGKVMEAFRTVGMNASVTFDDPLIHATIEDMGGWPALCQSKADELPFTQARFANTYRSYDRPGASVKFAPRLPGLHEMSNAAAGHAKLDHVFVGDKAMCAQVERLGSFQPRALPAPADQARAAVEALENVTRRIA